jgi:hypothetical protein
MKKSLMFGTALAAVVALTAGSPAKAACPTGVDSMPLVHGFGTAITNCKDASPVGFYAYQLGAEGTVTSGGQDGVCEAENPATNGIGQTCNPGPGVIGDGMVTVQYDWGNFNPGSVGCPTPVSQGVPTVVSQVVCNDGAGAIIAVGFEGNFGAYTVDLAFPLDPTQGIPTNVAADYSNTPLITGHTAGPSPSVSSVSVHLNPTHIMSDCDPTAAGSGFSCVTGSSPVGGIGHVYTLNAPCGTSPDPRISAGWALAAQQPNASGDTTVSITTPPTGCVYVGATGMVGGVETVAVTGFLPVASAAASVDKIKIDKASFSQGKLFVSFSTINETSIVGFNVYAGSTKLNSGLVQAKGTGSNTYSYEAARADVKANRTVTVEAVKSDGSVEKSSPVSLK